MPVNVNPEYPGCPATVSAAVESGVVLRPARWGVGDAIAMIAICIALSAVGGVALRAADAPLPLTVIVSTLLGWVGLAGWPILVTAIRGNGPRIDLGLRLNWTDLGMGLVGGVAAWVILAIVALVTLSISGDFTSAAGEVAEDLLAQGNRGWLIAFALAVGLGAPIVEEIAFRGLFYSALRKRGLHVAWVIGITAVAFAALHFEPVRLPLLMAMGVVTGILRWKTGAIGAPIVAHATVNLPGAVLVAFGLPPGT